MCVRVNIQNILIEQHFSLEQLISSAKSTLYVHAYIIIVFFHPGVLGKDLVKDHNTQKVKLKIEFIIIIIIIIMIHKPKIYVVHEDDGDTSCSYAGKKIERIGNP